MDRFEYIEARLFEGENYLKRDKNVKIYDGDDKVTKLNYRFFLINNMFFFNKLLISDSICGWRSGLNNT